MLTLLGLLWFTTTAAAKTNAPAAAPPTLVFVMPEASYLSMQGLWVESIYREVFTRLGLQIRIIPLPTKRASALQTAGEVDGEVHRSVAYAADHPELVRVRVPHFAASFAAYSNQPQLRLDQGWNSFNATRYRVDHLLGSITSGKELSARIAQDRLSDVNTIEQGLLKLEAHRSDVLVALDLSVDPMLLLPKFRDRGIVKIGVMEKVDGYLYLQKRHAALRPAVAQQLARMQRNGRIDKLGEQARRDWQDRQQ